MPAIDLLYELDGVTHVYNPSRWRSADSGKVTALSDVTLSISRGEFLCILGRSGEGKSTLLHLLGGLDQPTQGSILYAGKSLREYGVVEFRRKQVGFIFQMFHLLPYKSALGNVAMGMTVAGFSRRRARREAQKWLEHLGLEDRVHHRPDQLSGGEKQRVAIARAMVKKPNVLLADEPTGNLDKESRTGVLEAISAMNKEHQVTVVMVTHNQDDAERYADRIVLIDDRRIGRVWCPGDETDRVS